MPKELVQKIATQLTLKEKSAEIESLLNRLHDIEPSEMARALFTLEFHKELASVLAKNSSVTDSSQLYFSRGLKDEIQAIYVELAKHLKAQTYGSSQLMNAIFDFFDHTMKSLVKVPHLVSSN